MHCPARRQAGSSQYFAASKATRTQYGKATKFTELMPQILYFPTFMFNQPPRIYWNLDNEGDVNRLIVRLLKT